MTLPTVDVNTQPSLPPHVPLIRDGNIKMSFDWLTDYTLEYVANVANAQLQMSNTQQTKILIRYKSGN